MAYIKNNEKNIAKIHSYKYQKKTPLLLIPILVNINGDLLD